MKNNDIERDIKFRCKINHLQGSIALPMSNGYPPTLSQIREKDRQLLKQQALEQEMKPIRYGLITGILSRLQSLKSKIIGHSPKVKVKRALTRAVR